MNGAKARAIRKVVCKYYAPLMLRDYHRFPDGSIRALGQRREYQDAKRASKAK